MILSWVSLPSRHVPWSSDVVAWFDLESDRPFRQNLDKNLHSTSQAKNKVKYKDLYEKKTYYFRNLCKWKDFIKKLTK